MSDRERADAELKSYDTDEYRVTWQGEPGSHALAAVLTCILLIPAIWFLGWVLIRIGFL